MSSVVERIQTTLMFFDRRLGPPMALLAGYIAVLGWFVQLIGCPRNKLVESMQNLAAVSSKPYDVFMV